MKYATAYRIGCTPSERYATEAAQSTAAVLDREEAERPFQPIRLRSIGGVRQADVEAAFPGWALLTVEAADTRGLGWPMNRTRPQWYRLSNPA